MEDTEVRTLLAKYAVTGDLTIKPMTQLSGGEVTKVRFAVFTWIPPLVVGSTKEQLNK